VAERPGRAYFLAEQGQRVGVSLDLRLQHFDGERLAGYFLIACQIDDTHAPAAQFALEQVATTQELPDHVGSGRRHERQIRLDPQGIGAPRGTDWARSKPKMLLTCVSHRWMLRHRIQRNQCITRKI